MPLFVGTRRILRPVSTVTASTPPTYFDSGAIAGSEGTTSLAVSFPASVAANDIAIIWAMGYENLTLPGTFTSETQVTHGGTATNFRLGWYRCTGSEGGTSVNVTQTSNQLWAQMSVFRGCTTSGTPYEGYASVTGGGTGSTTLTTPAVVSTVANTLGVLIALNNGNVTATAASGGYTERLDNSSTAGTNGAFAVDTLTKETAGSTAAGTKQISAATFAGYAVFGLALMPA